MFIAGRSSNVGATSSLDSVAGHMRPHSPKPTPDAVFPCPNCEAHFEREDRLRRHELSHQYPKFKCDHEGCGMLFHRRDVLKRHKQVHVNIPNKQRRKPRRGPLPQSANQSKSPVYDEENMLSSSGRSDTSSVLHLPTETQFGGSVDQNPTSWTFLCDRSAGFYTRPRPFEGGTATTLPSLINQYPTLTRLGTSPIYPVEVRVFRICYSTSELTREAGTNHAA